MPEEEQFSNKSQEDEKPNKTVSAPRRPQQAQRAHVSAKHKKATHAKHTAKSAPTKSSSKGDATWVLYLIVGIIVVIAAILAAVFLLKPTSTTGSGSAQTWQQGSVPITAPNEERVILGERAAKVTIVEYSDFQCPFCSRALPTVKEVLTNFGSDVNFVYKHFPLSFHPHAQKAAEASECARDQDKFVEYHDKLFENQNALDVNNLKLYAGQLGLDTAKFNTCLDSGIKAALVAKDTAEGQAAGVSGTPGFLINGQLLVGAQPYEEFVSVICTIIPENDACTNIPTPVETELVVLYDATCTLPECSPANIIQVSRSLFKGVTVRQVDYNTAEGKEIYATYDITYLPAYLFDERVTGDANYARVSAALTKVDDKYIIIPEQAGASYDPTAEKCTNGIDDTADGLIDCADPQCSEKLTCRPRAEKKLDVFVMSQCPYGTRALDAMQEVLANFAGNIDFDVHYIATASADGQTFQSLHGQAEVDENIRELCVMNQYPDDYQYMDYVWCRNQNIQSAAWEGCARDNGMNVDTIKTCAQGAQGKALLAQNIQLAQELDIGASPTWLVNNQRTFSGIDAETIKQQFCTDNPGTPGCENTLSGSAAAGSAPAAGCIA